MVVNRGGAAATGAAIKAVVVSNGRRRRRHCTAAATSAGCDGTAPAGSLALLLRLRYLQGKGEGGGSSIRCVKKKGQTSTDAHETAEAPRPFHRARKFTHHVLHSREDAFDGARLAIHRRTNVAGGDLVSELRENLACATQHAEIRDKVVDSSRAPSRV